MYTRIGALAALAVVPLTLAQTYTTCNPTTNSTCPADTALNTTSFSTDFTAGSSGITGWTLETGTTLTYGSDGAVFTISKAGQAPTIETDFYIFFGTIEVEMQAAPGVGIVSSIVFESDDLDEVDWEIVGSDTTHAQSDYFGKGNTTAYDRAVYQNVTSPQTEFHTYKFDWSAERIIWSIDGVAVRTLLYADANGGDNFPQTPMRLKIGSWAAGCPTCAEGTAEWAGGYTDYSDGPFIMYVKSVSVTNANPAKEYIYGDMTGDWQSIEVIDSAGNKISTDSSSTAGASSSSSSTSSSSKHSSTSSAASSSKTKDAAATKDVSVSKTTSTSSAATTSSKSSSGNATATSSSKTSASSVSNTSSSSIAVQTTSGAASGPAMAGLTFLVGLTAFIFVL